MARRCQAACGVKVEFSDYIMGLWHKIGYVPGELEVAAVYDDHGEDVDPATSSSSNQTGGSFTPAKIISDPDKFQGVIVKHFPKDTDHGVIMEFLIMSGLPEEKKEAVLIKQNGSVTIKDIDNSVCKTMIVNIHNKKHFDKKLFCNGIIPLRNLPIVIFLMKHLPPLLVHQVQS